MGRDKASVIVAGSPLLDHMIEVAASVGTPIYVVGRDRPLNDTSGVIWIADEHPGEGPLPAIATLLRQSGRASLVVACDMPLLGREHLMWLIEAWSAVRGNGGAVTRSHVGIEPLFAIYEPSVLPTLDASILGGQRMIKPIVVALQLPLLDLPAHLVGGVFNVNTPDDLEQAKNRTRERDW